MRPILILGAGRMGGALCAGWQAAGAIAPSDLIIREPCPGADVLALAEAGARLNPPDEILAEAGTVLLAVKPQIWREAVEGISDLLAADADHAAAHLHRRCPARCLRHPEVLK